MRSFISKECLSPPRKFEAIAVAPLETPSDIKVNKKLNGEKINYVRFWEHDILNDRNKIRKEIQKII